MWFILFLLVIAALVWYILTESWTDDHSREGGEYLPTVNTTAMMSVGERPQVMPNKRLVLVSGEPSKPCIGCFFNDHTKTCPYAEYNDGIKRTRNGKEDTTYLICNTINDGIFLVVEDEVLTGKE